MVPVMPDVTDTASDVDARTPRTYLGWAVAVTVLFFLPTGLVAVFFGLRANSARADGRSDDALRAGRAARRWVVVTVIIGVIVDIAILAALLLLGAYSQ